MEPKPDSPVIEMKDVAVASAISPSVAVIDQVNWTVNQGQFWVVGGLPSSGKSDLLSTAAGLLRPLRGKHRLFGHDLAELSEDDLVQMRLRVGLVFANEGRLFHHLSIAENLALPIAYHQNCSFAEAAERVDQILKYMNLEDFAGNAPSTVTRAVRQKIGLARALVLNPEVLLLDDPLRASDPRQIRWWMEFLQSLCRGNELFAKCRTTLVVATDDFRPWLQQGEKFALIKNRHWVPLGDRSKVDVENEPMLRDLLGS